MNLKRIELLSNEPLSEKLINKWFWLYFFWYLTAPLRYITRLIISNSPNISVADFWLMYSIISLITILYTYNDLWLTESLQFFLPRFILRKEYNNIKIITWICIFVELITWSIISLWLRFWSNWLSIHYFQDEAACTILKYFCFYFIWNNILQVIQSVFKALQKTFEFQLTEFIKVFSILLLTIFFFFNNGNIESYSLSRILGLWIAIIVAFFLYKKYRNSLMKWKFILNKHIIKEYLNYSYWTFIWFWLWNLFWQAILQIVLLTLWKESAWYYSNFLWLYSIWITILRPIRSLLYPLVSEYKEKSETQTIEKLITLFYNVFSIITLSLSTLLIVLWPEISTVLLWVKYQFSWILLSYSWIFLLFNILASFNIQILSWIWEIKKRVFITWIACLATIISAIIWIKIANIYWACVAFGIGHIIHRVLSFYHLKKEQFKFKLNLNFIIKNVSLLLILWIVIHSIKNNINRYEWNRWIAILRIVIFCLIFYSIIAIFNKKEINTIANTIKH